MNLVLFILHVADKMPLVKLQKSRGKTQTQPVALNPITFLPLLTLAPFSVPFFAVVP